jgi:hypothetical protein
MITAVTPSQRDGEEEERQAKDGEVMQDRRAEGLGPKVSSEREDALTLGATRADHASDQERHAQRPSQAQEIDQGLPPGPGAGQARQHHDAQGRTHHDEEDRVHQRQQAEVHRPHDEARPAPRGVRLGAVEEEQPGQGQRHGRALGMLEEVDDRRRHLGL